MFLIVRPLQSTVATDYWSRLDDGRLLCELCPRACKLSEGQRGLCFVRAREDDAIVLTSYARSSGFAVDPIEKKPLNHFLPGTPVLSFGTAGCNLTCKFCQNWDISKSRQMDTVADAAGPEEIVQAAERLGCRSVAFTYNDPVDVPRVCAGCGGGVQGRGHSNGGGDGGLHQPGAEDRVLLVHRRGQHRFEGLRRRLYRRIAGGGLAPVLDTLRYLRNETDVWFEITDLVIPDHNDSEDVLRRMSAWIVEELGPDVPLHFSAFHPNYKMLNVPPTSRATLHRARQIAMQEGVHHVYTGNIHDREGDTTCCAKCGSVLIARDWYEVLEWNLREGCCPTCGTPCVGVFEPSAGAWGARRLSVKLGADGIALS